MQKTKIDWCTYVFNPITGCLTGCAYCYARKIAERFGRSPCESSNCINTWGCAQEQLGFKCDEYQPIENIHELDERVYRFNPKRFIPFPFGFEPTFHKYRLEEPQHHKKPQRIFVCSMADLFGPWVPDEWIMQVFDACKAAPQHRYMFLTKFPWRYRELLNKELLPELSNFFYGTTATTCKQIEESFRTCNPLYGVHTFLSIEPMLEDIGDGFDVTTIISHDLMIFGAETGNRKDKVVPKKEWMQSLVDECTSMCVSVFMKDSLIPIIGEEHMLRQMPEGLQL